LPYCTLPQVPPTAYLEAFFERLIAEW